MSRRRGLIRIAVLALAAAVTPAPGTGQSTLARSPDLAAGWVGVPGRVYFNLLHRFDVGPAPARKVTNTPTLVVGAPIASSLLLGFHYATSSPVARGRPNEWELFGRWAPLGADGSVELATQAGYNLGAASVDGELTVAGRRGPLRAFAVGRAFSGWRDTRDARLAAGAGVVLRLAEGVALAGDVVTPLDPGAGEDPAWSAGVQLRIPYTPHTLSLHASNAATTTLQGSTIGSGRVRYGFEFTVPITLRRYLPRGDAAVTPMNPVTSRPDAPSDRPSDSAARPAAGGTRPVMAGDTVEIRIESLAYGTERVVVEPGATVVWVNADPVAHSTTADDGSWDSGLIQPGQRWTRTFSEPGQHTYHCTPHPFMKAVVVVRAEEGMD